MSVLTASTANYLWSLHDVLGQGATASVYKARNKKSGELVAVKVFNVVSYNRPHEVQMREFEMLRKLNHSNIVKLFTVEELPSKQKVLVMEYCSGGSLLSLLEEPENAFGLPETEFLTVLQCVVQGMNHLRENGVVHRDIKPGNIMRQVGEDGKSVYKLTDFGAARELEDDEKFLSIYGTEEYLHPDMYERAVLRKPHQKSYGVSVDLWSIGVTFYHAATGSLPFIPYGGPRRNKPTMYKITTEKPMGAISGIQRVLDGQIEWSYHLPHSCQLSQGLTVQLVPVLAGILEADQERCWGFDQFFTATTDILQRQPVHLFALQQAMAHCIYIHHYNTVSVFYEEVASQTGIGVQLQHLLYLGHDLPLEGNMKVVNLPSTSPARPLILLSYGIEANTSLPFREPETPVIPSRFDVLADYNYSRVIVGVVHQYLRIVQLLHTHRELLLHGYYSYMMRLRKECGEAMHSIAMITIRLQSCLNTEHRIHTVGHNSSENQGPVDNSQKLQLVHEHLPMYAAGIQEFQNRLDHLQIEQAKLAEALANDKSSRGRAAVNSRMLRLRCKTKNGSHIMQGLTHQSCVQELKSKVEELTGIPCDVQKIMVGYPPSSLDLRNGDAHLKDYPIKSGDTLIVEEEKNKPKPQDHPTVTKVPRLEASPVLARRVVPADNSCLFTSVYYVVEGGVYDPACAPEMRGLIAQIVSSDPAAYSEAVLGKTNEEYCTWIRRDDTWGGAIEVSILSKFYQCEICVVDTQTVRVDRFGEDAGYHKRVLLIYDGIHYDPLQKETPGSDVPPLTIFSTTDDVILAQALELADEARRKRQFTDVNRFALRCMVCQTGLVGQKEAREHAKETGHTNFGEV